MKTDIKTLRRLVREAYHSKPFPEKYQGALIPSAIPKDVFNIDKPNMSKMSPAEAQSSLADIRDNAIAMMRSIYKRALGNTQPKPGELGVIRQGYSARKKQYNAHSKYHDVGPDYEPTPELASFMGKMDDVEAEFSRRNKEYDLALKREGEARWNAKSPEERAQIKKSEDETNAMYGGAENRRRGYGLGT